MSAPFPMGNALALVAAAAAFFGASLLAGAAQQSPAVAQDETPAAEDKAAIPEDSSKKGYWFYEKPPDTSKVKSKFKPLPPPPTVADLDKLHPKEVEKLIEEYRQNALFVMKPQEVTWYYQLQDYARRKSRAFMNVTEYVMLQNPGLNMNTEYPTTPPGMNARVSQRTNQLDTRLAKERDKAALVMLSRPECGFCAAQKSILNYFEQKYGWEVREVNLNEHPELSQKFATNYTPTTLVIFRNSDKWMPVAVGVESLPRLEEGVYSAVRLIYGETTPDQYSLHEREDGGLLDPQRREP